jgi:hypothetical protein
MAYNTNNNSNSSDNHQTNNKTKPVIPTIGEAVKEAVETGKEIVIEGPTEAGDITGVTAENLFHINEQKKINKEIVNGIAMSLDNGDDSKIAINVKDPYEETSLIEDKIIINPESSEVTEATVASVTSIPAEGGIEVEVQTEVEVPIEDTDKDIGSESKLKVKSQALSTEIPLMDEQSSYSNLINTSPFEKEKTSTSLNNPGIQQQSTNDGVLAKPAVDDIDTKTGIKMTDISQYEINDEMQKRAFKSTQSIVDDYMKFQNQAIISFQEIFVPVFDNTNNIFLTNQTFCNRILEIYSRASNIYTENTIALGKMINEITTANIFAYRNLFNIAKENSR